MTPAFGGAPLCGTKIMRLVYLDEAGISNLAQEPFLVVAGVAINADLQFKDIESHLDGLVQKHIPEEKRDGIVLHSMELFHGTKRFPKEEWPLEKRLEILDDLAASLRSLIFLFVSASQTALPPHSNYPSLLRPV